VTLGEGPRPLDGADRQRPQAAAHRRVSDAGRPSWELVGSGSVRQLGADLRRRAGVVLTYALSHLLRRDRRVWVFGNVRGYRDNPRYLAEYLVATESTVRPWWIARDDAEAAAARAAGLRVAIRGRPDAARAQRRAGVAFLSNGFQDLEAPNPAGRTSWISGMARG
jgi:hypothetical protein